MATTTTSIRYYAFKYSGSAEDCDAALARYSSVALLSSSSSSSAAAAAAVTSDRVLGDMWARFGAASTVTVRKAAVAVDDTCTAAAAVVGQKRPRSEEATAHATQTADGGEEEETMTMGTDGNDAAERLPPSSSLTAGSSSHDTNLLFPYPPMKLQHLAAMHIIVAAYATKTTTAAASTCNKTNSAVPAAAAVDADAIVNTSSATSSSSSPSTAASVVVEFAGAAGMVMCPINSTQQESYLQFLWVDPSYRRNSSNSLSKGVMMGMNKRASSSIGSTLLEMAVAHGFNLPHLSGACKSRRVLTAVTAPTVDSAAAAAPAAPPVVRCRLHTMCHRPIPSKMLLGSGVATTILRDREERLSNYFAMAGAGAAKVATTAASAAYATAPTAPLSAAEMTDIVANLYANSFGFYERRHIKGYYDVTPNTDAVTAVPSSTSSTSPSASILVAPTNATLLKVDAVEMVVEKRDFEAVLRQRQSKYY